ncbi:MAG: hypothetical protein AAFZ15_19575 [Bacteroidota bacterium]
MKKYSSLLKYFGFFMLLYLLLFFLFSTTPVASVINNTYRSVTTPVLESIFPKAYLKLEKDSPPESDIYTIRAVFTSKALIEEAQQAARQQGSKKVDLKAQEYDLYLHRLFTSFFLFLISLIIITPINWKQKLLAILTGSILFYGYTVFKIYIFLADLFNRSGLDIYSLSDTGGSIVQGISYVIKSLGTSALVVVIIWILTAFRKSNWKEILKKVGEQSN